VGHEGARGLHPVAHEGGGIVDIAVLARGNEVLDGLLELRTGGYKMLGQAEHRLKRAVADRQTKVCVIDRQGLLDQVQARAGQMTRATAMSHRSSLVTAPLRSDALPAVAVKRGQRPVTIRKNWEKVRQNLTWTRLCHGKGSGDRPAQDGRSWTRGLGGAPRREDKFWQTFTAPPGAPQSVPALLARNVAQFGSKPAYREKEYGIWQTWSWAETAEEIEAIANGLLALGVERGDYIAVIGRNRPALYWSMVAAQKVGAIPVPLYQDAVAEEMAYVLEHCGARFVIAGDQEQVDKVIEVQERVHQIEHIIYQDPRGLRKYDHTKLHALSDVQAEGRAAHERFE
jgi:hypothetical protein